LFLTLGEIRAGGGDGRVQGEEDVGVFLGDGGDAAGFGGGGGFAWVEAEVGFGDGGAGVGGDEMDALEGFAELLVGEFVEGVEVGADGAGEEDGVLRDDGEAGAEVVEFDGGDVDAVDDDTACSGFEEAEKS
jgi:hypothetical protein